MVPVVAFPPATPFTSQVTVSFNPPITVATSCSCCPGIKAALVGEIESAAIGCADKSAALYFEFESQPAIARKSGNAVITMMVRNFRWDRLARHCLCMEDRGAEKWSWSVDKYQSRAVSPHMSTMVVTSDWRSRHSILRYNEREPPDC
jgi:hypothetical protein